MHKNNTLIRAVMTTVHKLTKICPERPINFLKTVALITLCCFISTCVFGETISGIAALHRDEETSSPIADALSIPSALGRVTDARYHESDTVVINIQDLHCNPEVQRNIAALLEILENKVQIKGIYQEGAIGRVDTTWLDGITKAKLRTSVIDQLMESGKLTGSEYYAVTTHHNTLINGIEEEHVYKENVIRLNTMLQGESRIAALISSLRERADALKNSSYNKQLKQIESMHASYSNGNTSAEDYYAKLNALAERVQLQINGYTNVAAYRSLIETEKQLKYKEVNEELEYLLTKLKEKLPYRTYRSLIKRAQDTKQREEFLWQLAQLIEAEHIPLSEEYAQLNLYMHQSYLKRKINPSQMLREERLLLKDIYTRMAENSAEREIVFISDYVTLLGEYLTNSISAPDCDYVQKNWDTFKSVWNRQSKTSLAAIEPWFRLMHAYYTANNYRNELFVQNTIGIENRSFVSDGVSPYIEHTEKLLATIGNAKRVLVVITGGFHTDGYTRLLDKRGISYAVITPAVTQTTTTDKIVYNATITEEAKIYSQTLAVWLLSQNQFDAQAKAMAQASISALIKEGISLDEINRVINDEVEVLQKRQGLKGVAVSGITFTIEKNTRKGVYTCTITSSGKKTKFNVQIEKKITADKHSANNANARMSQWIKKVIGSVRIQWFAAQKAMAETGRTISFKSLIYKTKLLIFKQIC
jgi:hypothetical protein